MAIATKVRERMVTALKRLLPIMQQQKIRDVSEADTVTLVKDLMAEVFGYDKYAELTGELAIRGTYCDLGVRLGEKIVELIEVKSIGSNLEDRHVKQAIDYGSNQGIEWVILTNGCIWRLYQIIFAKPIDKRLLAEVDITTLDLRKEDHLERLYLFSKEGFTRGVHLELKDRQDATSRYLLAALVHSNEAVISCIRRELRRIVDVLVDDELIVKVMRDEVIKRDCLEGPEAESASRRVGKIAPKPKQAPVPAVQAAAPLLAPAVATVVVEAKPEEV